MKPDLPIKPHLFARYLFFFTAAVLDVFALVTFLNLGNKGGMAMIYAVYAFMMFIDAAVMLFCGMRIQNKRIYWLAIVVLGLNILLTVFDQFGLVDLLFVVLNGFTLYILLAYREELIGEETTTS